MNLQDIKKATLEELDEMMKQYCNAYFGHEDWQDKKLLKFDPFIKHAFKRLDKLKIKQNNLKF